MSSQMAAPTLGRIAVAVLTIGLIGFVLDRVMLMLQKIGVLGQISGTEMNRPHNGIRPIRRTNMPNSYLSFEQVSIEFPTPKGPFKALDNVNLHIDKGNSYPSSVTQAVASPRSEHCGRPESSHPWRGHPGWQRSE